MRVIVEFNEHTVRRAEIEADSVEAVEQEWELQYDSVLVDEIENNAIEVDGGIDWNSVEIRAAEPGVPDPRPRWRLTGNYGSFEIQREIHARCYDEARERTGVMVDLEKVGWTFTSSPDGEEWEIEAWDRDNEQWCPIDEDPYPDYPGDDEPRLTGHPPNPETEDE